VKWSGGLCVQDHGVEHLMSSRIANSLYDAGSTKDDFCYVTLETSFGEILAYANTTIRGRPSSRLNKSGRCDVVYYDKAGKPVGLVEVKRWFGFSRQKDDIQRIEIMLKKCESIRWGAVAAIRQRWDMDKISGKQALKNFINEASVEFPGCQFRQIHEPIDSDPVEFDGHVFNGYDALGVLITRRR
jgi:hypothetical protein